MSSPRVIVLKFAIAGLFVCGGLVHAATTNVLQITDPGYYAGDVYSLTPTPTIEWYDSAPGMAYTYRVEVGVLRLFSPLSSIWTGTVSSVGSQTDYSKTYSGSALDWDKYYYINISKVSRFTGKTVNTAFDFFWTAELGIVSIDYSGSESVTIQNNSTLANIDMTGFRLTDHTWSYYFPSFTLNAGQSVRVHTGHGSNTATDLYWGYDSYVWNDDGDTGYLYDELGELIDSYHY